MLRRSNRVTWDMTVMVIEKERRHGRRRPDTSHLWLGRGRQSGSRWRRRPSFTPEVAATESRRAIVLDPRLGVQGRWCWWLLAVAITLLATVAAFSSSPGWYVTDNRFEQFWAPGRVISRFPWLWDPSRGLGGVRGELTLIPGSVLAFLRGVGASPAVTERLWHVALLTAAGLGAAVLLRAFRPTVGLEHAVAGLFYAFNPYSAVFLVPSGLFLHYAVAPWLLVAFLRGTTGGDRWLWPAVFALLVAVSGTLDPPGLAYSLLLLVPAGLYLVLVERTASWRSVLAWGGRAGVLALVVSAAVLVQLVNASSSLSTRLFGTESVEAIHKTTSWAESWRGLGFWASYFPDGSGLLRQHHAGYFDPLLILATFVPAAVGLVVLGWSRWKPRVLMGAFALVSLALMVGPFPPEQPMPLGQLLLGVYDRFPVLTALRTSYKAGAGLAIGVGCLLAAGVAAARKGRGTATGRAIPVVAALVLIGVVSVPFWTGRMYSPEDRMRQVPSYWSEALAWLDRRPDDARALILPGTSNTRYRWGSPGDDIFDGLLRRPHLVYTSFPVTTPRAYDLERAIDEQATSERYRPGTLAPVARRLGLGYVVVRNDLDWQRIGRPRPAALQALRSDPDLELIAEFGNRGQNTVAPGDGSRPGRSEAGLHPVEIFRVKDAPEPVRGLSPMPPLLVAGDGTAWFRLAAQGLLDGRGPMRYTAESDGEALERALAAGSEVVITDTNRRQVTLLTRFGEMDSYTLAPGDDVGRDPGDLFQRPGSQSVAVFGDATRINSAGAEAGSGGFEAWSRPAAAVDGDAATSWLTGAFEDPVGRSLQMSFADPQTISEIGVSVARAGDAGREVTAASVRFSDGSRVPLELVGGHSRLRIPPRRTTSLEIRIDAVGGAGENAVGFSEIALGDLDLSEFVQVPDDLFRAADRSPALARELERAPLRYLFERAQGEGLVDTERALRRRFRTAGTRSYLLSGTLVVDEETPDQVVDLLAGAPVGAATGDEGPGPCTRGIVTLDGDEVPVRRTGPLEDLRGGVGVPFSGCDDVGIGPGWHELESRPGVSIDTVALTTGEERGPTRSSDRPRVAVSASGRAAYTLQVDAPGGGAVVSGFAYDPGWRAAIDGEDLGPPQPMDAQAAWPLPGPGTYTVEMRYQPQGAYDAALVTSGSGIALCLWLVAKRRRS